ncbi:MAG: UPF0149 family protein, partial [Pseudomonadota bacterium]
PIELDLSQGPLSERDFEHLDELFEARMEVIERVVCHSGDEDHDPGIISVSELDGYLTAIVSSPELVLPSAWLPALWGDFPLQLEDAPTAHVNELIFRHMNTIVTVLMEAPESYQPIFIQVIDDDERHSEVRVEPWCLGYLRAVSLSGHAWERADEVVGEMLTPIMVGSGLDDVIEQLHANGTYDDLCEVIGPAARSIHAELRALSASRTEFRMH